ncbi:MAG: hypothetical protein K9J12_06835, partial [Melioribacteraceae bacterium]|nr:hypothetical protein [Melioribacteraceae bacterium]
MRKKQKTGKFSIFGTIQRAKFLMSVILFSFSCGTNDPIIEDNTKPGRRDYEWTLDTLYSPNNWLSSIWGASPNSVWLAGAGGITNYDRLWYFNGETWAPYTQQ